MSLLPILFYLLFLLPFCSPWTIPTYLDLLTPQRWTAPPGDRYMYRNGTFTSPAHLNSCLNSPVPANVTRTPFPVSNGRAIFGLVNNTIGNPTNESFHMDVYMPHLYYKYLTPTTYNEGVQNTYQSARNMWRFYYWQNFPTQGRCYIPMNMTQMITSADDAPLQPSDLVGLNATLMFELSNVRKYKIFEGVDECAYVTLTDDEGVDEDIVPCDSYNPLLAPAAPSPSPSPSARSSGVRFGTDRACVVVAVVLSVMQSIGLK